MPASLMWQVLMEESARALGLSPLYISAYVLLSITIVGVLFTFVYFSCYICISSMNVGPWEGKPHLQDNRNDRKPELGDVASCGVMLLDVV